MYLVVECLELSDQWECDAHRCPVCLTENYNKYNRYGYEIYRVMPDGTFNLLRHYDGRTVKKATKKERK